MSSVRQWAGAILAAVLVVLFPSAAVVLFPSAAGASTEQINGSGSSWAFNAVNQWITDVTQRSLRVAFTPSGSAQGRQDYANGVTDFAVSDIGYQGVNPITGGNDRSNRAYAYLPMVAGGTAFPYNIVVGGHRVENVRLSALTLAKIFTDQITNWNDPEITADNNGRMLPSIPIIPVIHSEGAGTTFQFTNFLFTQYPSLWQSFSGYHFPVEYWPTGKGHQVSENGSDGVMSFIQSAAGQGAIGFDEYSYALGAGFPVAAIENRAGYFVLPDAYNVAVALTQAQINMDKSSPNYLLETLNRVYVYNDPRTYPLSSYTYMIEPTSSGDRTMNTAKRQTLADFIDWSICQGQREMAPIGYSPMPINLVEASYQQMYLLHQADAKVDISNLNVVSCHNPTFIPGQPNNNYLAKIAPLPPPCAKVGQGPCGGQYTFNGNPVSGHAGGQADGGASSAVSAAGTGSAGGGSSAGGRSAGGAGSSGGAGTSATGQSVGTSGSSHGGGANGTSRSTNLAAGATGSTSATTANLTGLATELSAAHPPTGAGDVLIELAVGLGLILLVAVPLYAHHRRRTR
jgi:phosphate ABC transporter phosphate-binding protein